MRSVPCCSPAPEAARLGGQASAGGFAISCPDPQSQVEFLSKFSVPPRSRVLPPSLPLANLACFFFLVKRAGCAVFLCFCLCHYK